MTKNTKNPTKAQSELLTWINEHKAELIVAGTSIPTIIAVVLGIKNKDAIKTLWDNLKSAIEERNMYSPSWFENTSTSTLHAVRETVRLALCASGNDFSTAVRLENLLARFDKELNRRSKTGQVSHGPAYHREHGGLYKPD